MCSNVEKCGKACAKLKLDDPSLDTAMRELPCKGERAEYLLEGKEPKADGAPVDHRAAFLKAVFSGSEAAKRRDK